MKALVLSEKGKLLFKEVETPVVSPQEVLLRVKACGVCGSDLPRIFGDVAYFYPLIPGHEFAGEVVEVGENVDKSWLGKRVTAYPLIPCRKCAFCEAGFYELCENYDYLGSRRHGAFAEYVAVPVKNLVSLPENISFVEGAMTEPAAVTFHALRRVDFCLGEQVAVFGLGPIGLLAGIWAKVSGARFLWGIDVDERKLSLAEEVGFDATLHPTFLSRVEKPAVVIEASGNEKALLSSLALVRKMGKVLLLGNQEKEVVFTPKDWSNIMRKELTLLGSWNSRLFRFDSDWEKVLHFEAEKRVSLSSLVSHRVPLEEAPSFLEAMYRKTVSYIKVIIEP
ncbi:MAG: galactitol-1-phosphate 5-dehydrogenase [Atribacterota bacterium]